MKKYNISIHCNMECLLTVKAENEESIKKWIDENSSELYSLIESPTQMASNLFLGHTKENDTVHSCVDYTII